MNLPFVVLFALLASVVASGILTAGVFALLRFRSFDATTRHGLWFATLIAVALLPVAGIAMSVTHSVPVSSVVATSGRRTSESPRQAELRPVSAQRSSGRSLGAATNSAQESASSSPRIGESPLARLALFSSSAALAVLAALLAIALLGIIWLSISVVRIGAVKRRSSPLDETLAHDLPWLTQTHRGRETYLRLSYEIEAPMAIGFTRPVILIPTELATHSGLTGIEDLVIHEHAHLVRYDDYTNLVQRAIERIFWFNPFVWAIGRRIALEREIAADDAVVARTEDRARYAAALWRLAREMRLPAYTLVAPGALFTRKQISVRIEALLAPGRAHLQRLGPASAAAVAIVGLVAYGLVALAAPPLELPPPPQAPTLPTVAVKAPPAAKIARPAPVNLPVHAPPNAAPHTVPNAAVQARVAAEQNEVDALRNKLAQANAQIQERKAAAPAVPVRWKQTEKASVTNLNVPPVNVKVPHVDVRTPGVNVQTPNINVKAPAVSLNIPGVHVNVPAVDVHVPALNIHVARTNINAPKSVAMDGDREHIAAATPLTRELLQHCTGCDLSHRDMRNLDLHGLSLSGIDLTGSDLRGANLSNVDLNGADLRDANLDGANLTNARFSGADIAGASFRGAKMDGVRFTGISLRHSAFDNANIRQILVHGCSGCDLSHMDLHGIDIHGLRLNGSDLSHSDLSGANLSATRFSGVSFDSANLDHADLRNAELTGCSLDGASLNGAQLEGIRLSGTSLGRRE